MHSCNNVTYINNRCLAAMNMACAALCWLLHVAPRRRPAPPLAVVSGVPVPPNAPYVIYTDDQGQV